jgi:hypothetical protein
MGIWTLQRDCTWHSDPSYLGGLVDWEELDVHIPWGDPCSPSNNRVSAVIDADARWRVQVEQPGKYWNVTYQPGGDFLNWGRAPAATQAVKSQERQIAVLWRLVGSASLAGRPELGRVSTPMKTEPFPPAPTGVGVLG